MKPIKLEIEGLHSFEKNQVLDFDRLSTQGIFGVFGATGSGKSTILDAIILALYGKVQRSKTNSDFINLKSNKAVVVFDFSFVEDGKTKVYSVKRVFKRKPKNPQEVDQQAEVFEVGTFGRRQVMEGATKVDNFITQLLGMSDAEFLKCIALPQGEFASFLKAKPNERVAIIGNIFDLNKYGQQLWEKVRARTERLEKERAVVDGKLAVVGPEEKERLEESRAMLDKLKKENNDRKLRVQEISKIEQEEREVARLGRELRDVDEALDQLLKQSDSMQVKKETLNKAKKLNENNFVFARTEELSKLIMNEEDEIYRLGETLKAERARSDEFYCESTLELEEIRAASEKTIAKLERLKALTQTDGQIRTNGRELETICQDLAISQNLSKTITNKINSKKIDQGLLKTKIKELDNTLEDLRARLSGFESILTYNNLSLFVKELSSYREYIDLKHAEAIQSMTVAIENKDKLLAQKADIEDELKALYKQFGLKGAIGSTKMATAVGVANETLANFLHLKGRVETILSQRLEIANTVSASRNALDRLEVEKVRLDLKFKQLADEISQIKEKINQVHQQKNKSISEQGLADVVGRIKIGDTCPICYSEVLRKAAPSSIDVMVLDEEISNLEAVLQRKEEARDGVLYSISRTVAKIEWTEVQINDLESKLDELKKKIVKLFESQFDIAIIDEEDELNKLESTLRSGLDATIKAEKQERLLLSKLQDIDEALVKNNCVSAMSRMEMGSWAELLENIGTSIKDKDIQLLSLVSHDENISEKLAKLDEVNKELEARLKEKDSLVAQLSEIDGEVAKLESELALALKDQEGLQDKISKLERQISEGRILIDAETADGDVARAIELEEAEYESYKRRESELLALQDDRKKGVATITAELNALEAKLNAHKEEHSGLVENCVKTLQEIGLGRIQEAKLFMMTEAELATMIDKIEQYDNDLVIAKNKKNELEAKLEGKISSPAVLEQMEIQLEALAKEIKYSDDQIVKLALEIDTLEERGRVIGELKIQEEKLDKEYVLAKDLYDILKGKALMEFIAEEFIDDISFMASSKLQVLMDGRYVLKYQNKEFFVVDNFNDASVRPVSTLSGGEMFVVSLALALSISDAIATKANKNIDFFFLDEGFGTLDKEYCEYIVDALIKLESQNLTIGLISHIPELQERISQKIEVVKGVNGSLVKHVSDI